MNKEKSKALYISLAIFIAVTISGCENLNLLNQSIEPKIKWATVDYSKIYNKLNDIALNQHPYPEKYNTEPTELKHDKHLLKKQISKLKLKNHEPCLNSKANTEKYRKQMILSPSYNPRYYDKKCLISLPEDLLIKDLEAQLSNTTQMMQLQAQYLQRLRTAVRKNISAVVTTHTKQDYDLVIDSKSKIYHSNTGSTLDITSYVLERINSEPPIISI